MGICGSVSKRAHLIASLAELSEADRFRQIEELWLSYDSDESGFLDYNEYVPMAHDFSEALLIAAQTALERLCSSPEYKSKTQDQRKLAEAGYQEEIEAMQAELPKIDSEHVAVKRMFWTADNERDGKVSKREFETFIEGHLQMLKRGKDY